MSFSDIHLPMEPDRINRLKYHRLPRFHHFNVVLDLTLIGELSTPVEYELLAHGEFALCESLMDQRIYKDVRYLETRYYPFDVPFPLPHPAFFRALCMREELYDDGSTRSLEFCRIPLVEANVSPCELKIVRKVRALYPHAEWDMNIRFCRKFPNPFTLYFIELLTNDNFVERYEAAMDAYRVWASMGELGWYQGAMLNWQQHFAEAGSVGPSDGASVGPSDGAAVPPNFLQNLRAALSFASDSPFKRPESGAVSEGHNPDMPKDYELTGNSVSADEIDDLLDRITEEVLLDRITKKVDPTDQAK